ncbi:hypothetical protein ACFU9X_32965 [Streptomyces atratus]|uniref:hypothetical protein n=1 Tax=Streptomyces atratus TaxID=1893 RepID=UPI0036C9A072
MKISAAQADELMGGPWFEGYTEFVDMYEKPVTVEDFDAEARAEANDDTEMVLFGGGLTVRDTLDLSSEVHSVIAVQGSLRARRLILGDAVLVVRGTVELDEWLFGEENEGLFAINDKQIESPDRDALFADLRAPVVAAFDRLRGEFVLREHGEPRTAGQLLPEILADADADPPERRGLRMGRCLRERLVGGQLVFR